MVLCMSYCIACIQKGPRRDVSTYAGSRAESKFESWGSIMLHWGVWGPIADMMT